jgi:hypothetical protein
VAPLLSFGMICSAIGNANAAPLVFTTQGSPAGGQKLGRPPNVASGQVAPLQLNSRGRAFTSELTPPGRKFDFRGLTTTGSSGLFDGVNGIQWTGNSGNPDILRSDYLAPFAGTCVPPTSIWGGGTCDWSDMEFTLRPFYFLGDTTCVICGPSNEVSLVNLTGFGKRMVSSSTSPVTIEDSVETLFALIPNVGYLIYLESKGSAQFGHSFPNTLLLIGAGFATIAPLLMFNGATLRLPLTTVGLLQYITPTIMFFIGILVNHEDMVATKLFGFVFIWVALIFLGTDLVKSNRSIDNSGA